MYGENRTCILLFTHTLEKQIKKQRNQKNKSFPLYLIIHSLFFSHYFGLSVHPFKSLSLSLPNTNFSFSIYIKKIDFFRNCMGVHCSCPLAVHFDLENGFESSATVKSDNLFNEAQLIHQSLNPEEMAMVTSSTSTHEAAIKLQKVYKSFRTRRKLADCAVLIEQSWWKILDFAELKHSSISFFELDKHETAVSRWSRARTRAAKVGKGLSKNGKAQKLARQHWLEAIDPRHRYGHNLHFYYAKWLNSQSKEPFFYWLDIGEGKEVNLIEKCTRLKLQTQCIKYLGPMERKTYEVALENGKLLYKQTGEYLDTTNEESKGSTKWIFVLSTSRTLYVGKKKKGSFQHSSFLAGGATLAAGRIVAENGVLKAVWPHSGHYRPTPENFQDFISFLDENNVDLTHVKLDSTDEEEEEYIGHNKQGLYLRNNSSDEDLAKKDRSHSETEENDFESNPDKIITTEEDNTLLTESKVSRDFITKPSALEIPSKDNLIHTLINQSQIPESRFNSACSEDDEMKEEIITEEHILRRINSHKEMNSYQLGKQLSCKWSSGAGPRIGCLRDYPSGLQCHALEQVKLSPGSRRRLIFEFSSRSSTPISSNIFRSCSSATIHSSYL